MKISHVYLQAAIKVHVKSMLGFLHMKYTPPQRHVDKSTLVTNRLT